MQKMLTIFVLSIFVGISANMPGSKTVRACQCKRTTAAPSAEKPPCSRLDTILKQLQQKTSTLKSYQCQIEYLFSQPLFDSQSLRHGNLYYQKQDEKTRLRINFNTLKQDDEDPQPSIEQYIFDGIWLTHLDYPNKHARKQQIAEPNKPADAFDLIGQNFPIIGFTKTENLQKQFDISVVNIDDSNCGLVHLHLIPRKDSTYEDDYTAVDCWIDSQIHLPAQIAATTFEQDVYQIKFLNPTVNKPLNNGIFDFQIPNDFDQTEIIPLEESDISK